jgi:hypothetical protein
MGCARVQVGGVTAVVCGPAFGRKYCRTCGAPAKALCDWPRLRKVHKSFREVKVGDAVLAYEKSNQPHKLVYLAVKPELGQVWLATEWQGRVMERVEYQAWRGIWVAEMGTCDAPCCYRHRRHVGPEKDYCARHWDAWKEVA